MNTHAQHHGETPRRWLLDLGNTRLKLARAEATDEAEAFEVTDAELARRVIGHIGPVRPGDAAWIASVGPAAAAAAVASALRDAGLAVQRARTQARMGALRIAYREPARLGVDRFLALLAASRRDDGPWLLVSAGSALTVDLLQADGLHVGGLIAPMPDTMRHALASRFPALDVPAGETLQFAADTADAIASGCAGAAIGLVERSLRQARAQLGMEPTLLLGGGGASLFAGIAHPRVQRAPALVLEGLALYADANPT